VLFALELAGLGAFASKVQRKLVSYEVVKLADLVDIADYAALPDEGVVRIKKLLTDPVARKAAVKERGERKRQRLEAETAAEAQRKRDAEATAQAQRKRDAEAAAEAQRKRDAEAAARRERELVAAAEAQRKRDAEAAATRLEMSAKTFSEWRIALADAVSSADRAKEELAELSSGALSVFRKGKIREAKAKLLAAVAELEKVVSCCWQFVLLHAAMIVFRSFH
jgi:hypothetical protein